ncbi:MAG: hydrogenase iron-sulfur subunit, partial [Chloroflexi bacterium]|nr:hydrogenase iron-sulfur subunit [Chloroflexota bacterium]
TKKRVQLLRKVLDSYGIEPERVRMELSLDPDGKRIPELVKSMGETVKVLGPVRQI